MEDLDAAGLPRLQGDDAAATVGVARARQVDSEAPVLEDNLKARLLADVYGQGPLIGGIEGKPPRARPSELRNTCPGLVPGGSLERGGSQG